MFYIGVNLRTKQMSVTPLSLSCKELSVIKMNELTNPPPQKRNIDGDSQQGAVQHNVSEQVPLRFRPTGLLPVLSPALLFCMTEHNSGRTMGCNRMSSALTFRNLSLSVTAASLASLNSMAPSLSQCGCFACVCSRLFRNKAQIVTDDFPRAVNRPLNPPNASQIFPRYLISIVTKEVDFSL